MSIKTAVAAIILVAIIATAGGCVKKIYVPVSQVRTDSLYDVRQHSDTLLARDSIYVGLRGDTVVREVYRWRVKSRIRVDTLYRTRVDSVPVVIPSGSCDSSEKSGPESPWKVFKRSLNVVKWITRILLVIIVVFYAIKRIIAFRN